MNMKYVTFKRFLDFVVSLVGFIVSLPFMILIWIAIRLESRGGAIFKQERLGRDGQQFTMYKFRTMVVGAEKIGTGVYSSKGDSRVTKVGAFLRATSLDELPQFINVLCGDMSMVGPRPVLTYHPFKWGEYPQEGLPRFKVRPGITGWAQVNGRRTVEWSRRFEYDAEYVNKSSLFFDAEIVFLTVWNVIASRDNSNNGKTV